MTAVEVVREFMAAVNRRAPVDIGEFMSEDFAFVDPQGRTQTGREPVTAAWQAYFQMFPDYEIRAETIMADGEFVAVFGTASGTFRTAEGALPGNRIAMPAAWRARVRGNRVALWQVYADWSEGLKIIARAQESAKGTRDPA